MRSLFVAPMAPEDAGNGLAMRMGVFLEALSGLGELDVILLSVFGATKGESSLCRRLGVRTRLVSVSGRVETHFSILNGLTDKQARLEAFVRYGKPSLSAYLSIPVLREIQALAGESSYDLVHVARSYLLPVIEVWSPEQRPVVSVDLDEDDAETHRRIARLHARRGDCYTGRWLEAEARAFDRHIARWLPQANVSFIATGKECEAIAQHHGIRPHIVANVVAVPSVIERKPVSRNLLFVGGFGYYPNLDAAYWLLEEIVPELMERSRKAVSMTMVGRGAPKRMLALAERLGVEVLDHVSDLAPVYASTSIALVPVRAGGGSRIKLLEAAAHRVPVVATSAGAENSGFEDGREIWIADTAAELVETCLKIWAEPEEAARRVAAARDRVALYHSRPAMISTLKSYFASCLPDTDEHRGEPS